MHHDYISRINKAFDYIESNLDRQITLEELAGVANFSKFHFNRIFKAIVGETPFQFIQRVRLEKAATLLISRKKDSIADIAFQCGFSELSIFSRNFKKYFSISASEYRKQNSNISQTDSKQYQRALLTGSYLSPELKLPLRRKKMKLNKSVEIKDMPKMAVAYVRHIGPYKGNEQLFESLWNRLFAWAGPRELFNDDTKSLCIYHDDPNVTSEDKHRVSVCITVPPETAVDGEVGKMDLEAARYVVARFELTSKDFEEAWDWVYGEWLPENGYQPDDKPCFELYPEEPKDGTFVVDICIPVKPL